MSAPRRSSVAALRLCTLAVALGAAALVSPAGAAASTLVSSNWAGYVARDGKRGFSSVSAGWTAPAATCTASRETHSAVWVGLGGYRERATALEQIGTDADCDANGRPSYSSWVELLPAAAQTLSLAVHPGDRLVASVTVAGRHATLRLRNLTTGRRYSTTRRLSNVDVSTADWIVEAPSGCEGSGRCRTLDLTNFGTVGFTAATATAGGRTSNLGSGPFTELLLRQDATAAAGSAASSGRVVSATPGPYADGAFTVAFNEGASAAAPEGPTLPGFSGEAAEG